jgi:hypothetical protein
MIAEYIENASDLSVWPQTKTETESGLREASKRSDMSFDKMDGLGQMTEPKLTKSNVTAGDEGTPQNFLGTTLDWKVTAEKTGGLLSLVDAHGFKGSEPPIHYHESADEFFYVIAGDRRSWWERR